VGFNLIVTMRTIGIRATPKKIFFAIINFTEDSYSISNQELVIPVSFDVPQKLKYVRKTMLDIFNEYDIILAGIRITEPIATPDNFRVMLEGVIQELIASSKVENYFAGAKISIASRLGLPNDGSISDFIDNGKVFHDIRDWNNYSTEYKEAILAAFAVTNI
jgi:hypothetical protein